MKNQSCLVEHLPPEMETLEEKIETTPVAEEANKLDTQTSELVLPALPIDVISEIFSRLPVKSLLRFKCISRMWWSIIHSQLFATKYLTRTLENPQSRYALLFIARDMSTSQCHFLSGSYLGGSTSRLFTLHNIPSDNTEIDHINGVALFRRQNGYVKHNFAFIINPSTHEVFKLPGKAAQPMFSYGNAHICYFFGFDPSTNQFKILNTRIIGLRTPKKLKIECGIFNLDSCSWKKIDPVFPFDLMGEDWIRWFKESLCIDGVIYIIFHHSYVIAAFDLREEKFSLIPVPKGAIPTELATIVSDVVCFNNPYLINYNGLLAIVCGEKVFSHHLVEMWILEDRDSQFWIKEIINLPHDWEAVRAPLPREAICNGELMFSARTLSSGCMQIPFYNMKQRSFRFTEVTLPPRLLTSDRTKVTCRGGYVESILHLRRNNSMRH